MPSPVTEPVVVIGLDGMAGPLVERWVASGELPVLRSIVEHGVRGPLHAPAGCNDDAMWASVATARRPERHGRLHFRRRRPGGYDVELLHRDDIDGVPFWQRVSDAGHTVAVLDVPKVPFGRELRGVELHDWNAHGSESPQPVGAPPALASAAVDRFAGPHGTDCLDVALEGAALSAWVDDRLDRIARTGDLVVDQVATVDPDLVVCAFAGAHCIGHQCWHVHDPGHPDHDPGEDGLGDPVLAAYRALDREVGRVVDLVGEDAPVLVFSGLGMGPNNTVGVLDAVLRRADRRGPTPTTSAGDRAADVWRRRVPARIRLAMPGLWHRAARRREVRSFARRSYFEVDTGARSGGIRLNLVGREPRGVVEPDAAAATLRRLEAIVVELVDDDSGEPIVADVERTADTRTGPYAGDLPDLLVHWTERSGAPSTVRSPVLGTFEVPPADRTGHHHDNGFYLARGPGLPAGVAGPAAEVWDLGPTVAAWMGVDLPDVDGAPMRFTAGMIGAGPG